MWDPEFELEPNAKSRMIEFLQTGEFAHGMQPGLALCTAFEATITRRAEHTSSACFQGTHTYPGETLLKCQRRYARSPMNKQTHTPFLPRLTLATAETTFCCINIQ
jgi:hypothetical protein